MAETLDRTTRYGALDRLLHRLAFAHPGLQRVLGDIENDLFRKRLADVRVERPVFVTGLPRAGTTLVLELLYGTGEFASFTYRQMPFVLNPLLWDRIGARSRKAAVAQERAHGDAMTIDFDSPEAFEEVLWINHLADRIFDGDAMRPLGPDDLTDEFRTAYRRLAEKLVCLASDGRDPAPRYLSKNNPNLARLPAISSVFGDATFLCCFRHPAAHVASLHAQHRRFLALHDDDAFAARYMAWIGHHDFGRNFRPIRFADPVSSDSSAAAPSSASSTPLDAADEPGSLDATEEVGPPARPDDDTASSDANPTLPEHSPTEPRFWLRYWIDAYRHVLDEAPPGTRLVCYESLLEDGEGTLAGLAGRLDLADPDALIGAAATLRAPTSTPAALETIAPELADEAERIYAELRARAG